MGEAIKVIDAHHHLWAIENEKYPWIKGPNEVKIHVAGNLDPIRKNYLVSDFLADAKEHNLFKSVHLQCEHENPLKEAEWLYEQHKKYGFPHVLIVGGNPASPEFPALLEAYSKIPIVRGIRHLLNYHETEVDLRQTDTEWLKIPKWVEGLGLLAKYNYSYDLHCLSYQAKEAVEVGKKYPNIQFIVNHTGLNPHRTPESFEKWKEAINLYASLPNFAIKLSGLGMFDHHWTVDSIRPYILYCIQTFGIDRCMFASNFPVDKLLSDYNTLYNAYKLIVKDFSHHDQVKLFQTNAEKFYRIS